MLREFISEYRAKFLPSTKQGFWGDMSRAVGELKDPSLHPSAHLSKVLDEILLVESEPLKIAVVGQFSSGKSTFLNTLLSSEVLPTGVVPVTAKATHIKYAPYEMMSVAYKNGYTQTLESSQISDFVDQRRELKDIKNINMFLPHELLKKINFIDTPGLNSRSNADTRETLEIFDEVFGVLWISLIDNAARKSETAQISLLPKFLSKNSIAILSQKDRLGAEEIERVHNYAKTIFGANFASIVPISSKLEKAGDSQNSGFSEVREFLDGLDKNRISFAKSRLNFILAELKNERAGYLEIHKILENIIASNKDKIAEFCASEREIYKEEFSKIYASIKETSKFIAKTMQEALSSKQNEYFISATQTKKSFFGTQTSKGYEKVAYEAPYFNTDAALSKLIYNDDRLNVIFRRFKAELVKTQNAMSEAIERIYAGFEREILLFKGRFENYERQSDLASIIEASNIAKIASEVYGLFLKDGERAVFQICQKIALFFEQIMIKIASNYTNAVTLSANFIANKIAKSISDYEEEPGLYQLFYPSYEDFEKAVLGGLHYYEFENDFVGSSSFVDKIYSDFSAQIAQIFEENLAKIADFKATQENALAIFSALENLQSQN
ncbi:MULTISPECIES: dynamin family protein [unclassified Campylobacter]|uniref:dynamin family protein n=1 Tax=unclassified Campylobacter TaxID=2593542 RepID=UPI0022E9EACD|nr:MULTISPECIES: dynamin family protein [unclassified Campylobacter]MDA3054959.1 dynamin family protein [Campylobacter sp. VBCF_07 NA4]MDA3070273.1 dynamin family protein [Campylobacter sp. VBCF_08 NA3]WBR54704.1 dynamin family protein [Campylobacter sp. VBCF_01 NA2]